MTDKCARFSLFSRLMRVLLYASLALAVAYSAPVTISKACAQDITLATADVTAGALGIASAVKDCATNSTKCMDDITGSVDSIARPTDRVSTAVHDCGGASTACAASIERLVEVLSNATAAISHAVDDCSETKPLKCGLDVANSAEAVAFCTAGIAAVAVDCANYTNS